ncbi:MAG: 2-phosphosulfolactate phosphatase [Verrucomicrobiae bacterium]|nr:2-phosphosulfolactate phosphatase [Verrucomicrobiae bacterium]
MQHPPRIHVAWTPADVAALADADLSRSLCVAIDVLRATSTMTVALAHGAAAIIPAAELDEARAVHASRPGALLCGERHGLPPEGFDLGNSPREFTRERVAGRTIVHTTTNGTRAVRACARAHETLLGCFLNIAAVADRIRARAHEVETLVLACAGTFEDFSMEDALFAGALVERLDGWHPVRSLWAGRTGDLETVLGRTRNGRRLKELALEEDIAFCAQTDSAPTLGIVDPKGWILAYR